jgi:hypothetical protein
MPAANASRTPALATNVTRDILTVPATAHERPRGARQAICRVSSRPRVAPLQRSGSSASWGDQARSRYPVLKIHATAAMHTIKKAIIMTRLTPALISEVP